MSGPRDPQAVDNLPPAHVPARRGPAWGQRFTWRAWPVAAVWLIGAAPSLVATTPVTAQAADTAGTASPAAQPRAIDLWRRMRAVEPRHYVAYRTAQPLAIDGRLDEPAWRSGSASAPFVDISANPALAPRHQTRMKICWDDEYLYVGAELDEPHVWATIVEHDAVIFRDPDFEVFIDPDSDNHDYYEFEMNALNTGWDLRLPKPYRDGGSALNEWEIAGLIFGAQTQIGRPLSGCVRRGEKRTARSVAGPDLAEPRPLARPRRALVSHRTAAYPWPPHLRCGEEPA